MQNAWCFFHAQKGGGCYAEIKISKQANKKYNQRKDLKNYGKHWCNLCEHYGDQLSCR